MGTVHVGTCSWTEKTVVGLWYPKGVNSPEQRLRYYASRFDTVEVDSSFYALPQRRNAELWVQRTPSDFTFHVKAYGMMTGHQVEECSLHEGLRAFPHEVTPRGRVLDPHPNMVDAAFDIFIDAIGPLRESGKLGGILMQFPPYFTAKTPEAQRTSFDYLDRVRAKLDGYRVLVEFRHSSWARPGVADAVSRFLADRDMSFVSVDSPQFESDCTMPPVAAVTSDWAYVRFHGRNADTWFGAHGSSADRFDYHYTPDELSEWEPKIRDLARSADRTFVMFNNNKYDYAQRNAADIATILGDLVPPRSDAGGDEAPSLF